MVKRLDENAGAALPDHVGWRLWQASRAWQAEFAEAMRRAGHVWFSESRAGLLGHIPRRGLRQGALIDRAGISKQAVQQLLDGLEAEGVIERAADPDDKRGKLVRYTERGLAALGDADRIKLDIERGYRERLGEAGFDALMTALRLLAAAPRD
ncbi:MarR family winged helix-turn-helix transcriptional regulator [Aminobacter sp. HY435]|uniref:MarR family winged helix-turn-helix transcriptional regulator n=1 Tax=Aminobacter sp. HY435 TaxID=2970917 RepID=UPI0022B941CF|nr:MarR family winged helix-turn-helix transcriptional regulator [Aminobacter sp. HY435]